ncbi:MAG: DoxX family membrane protein [Actinomycetota bacterium]|nr:DoxX family membrane protein [Actinomycetota bacterium]
MPDPINDRPVNTGNQPSQLRLTFGERDPEAQPPAPRRRARSRPAQRLEEIEFALHRWLVAHSVTFLRVSLGAVFLGFGFLKFFPGVSPAEDLVVRTTSILTFDLLPDSVAIVAIAVLECVIGLWLISGRALRGAIYLLAVQLVGILAPVVLLGGSLFSGPHGAPTLQGQYVLKDVILVGAVLVIAATVRGGRLTSARRARPDPRPAIQRGKWTATRKAP